MHHLNFVVFRSDYLKFTQFPHISRQKSHNIMEHYLCTSLIAQYLDRWKKTTTEKFDSSLWWRKSETIVVGEIESELYIFC